MSSELAGNVIDTNCKAIRLKSWSRPQHEPGLLPSCFQHKQIKIYFLLLSQSESHAILAQVLIGSRNSYHKWGARHFLQSKGPQSSLGLRAVENIIYDPVKNSWKFQQTIEFFVSFYSLKVEITRMLLASQFEFQLEYLQSARVTWSV